MLDFVTENGTNFGDQLQGQPLGSSNPGRGYGNTYNFSVGSTYMLSSTLVMDAHVGFVRMNSNVAQTDLAENKGLDWLGLPGTNGDKFYEGGTPLFDLDTYADLGTTDTFMPYYRSDDQLQTVFNTSWTKGGHNVRFGTDIYYQALNHTQPEISGGDSFGARGGFRYQAGTTQLSGRAERQSLQRLRVVPARSAEPRRPAEAGRALHDAQLAVQPLRARPVAADVEAHGVVRHALGVLPGSDARQPRPRALQRRHQPDDDRRRRLGAEGSRRRGQQDDVRAARRRGVPGQREDRAPRRVRDHQRSLFAGPADADEPPGGAQPPGRRAQPVPVREPDLRRHPGDSRPRSRERHDPRAEPDHRVHAVRQVRARLHQVVERRVPARAGLGVRRRGGLRRDPAGRSARIQGAELVADRRRAGRPPAQSCSTAAPARPG